MEAEEEEKITFTYDIKNEERQFAKAIYDIFRQSSGMDQLFLCRINDILQSKNIIQAIEISDLSLVLSLSVVARYRNQPNQSKKQQLQKQYKTIEQLHKVIFIGKRPVKQIGQSFELMGWISKIWDKMLHFSCYKNHLDLLVLYYFIGDFLLYNQVQFKRLLNLLLQSVSKFKIIQGKTLEMVIYLITFFCDVSQSTKNISLQTKTKLKMISVLYLAKMNNPKISQVNYFKNRLEEVRGYYIHILMESLQKIQEGDSCYQQQIIWDKLFSALLSCYSKYEALKQVSLKIMIEMISFKLDLQTMKLLIRQLQITNQSKPLKKWQEIYQIMDLGLKIYDKPKQCLSFLTSKSYIKYPLNIGNAFIIQVQLKTSSYILNQQRILFMLQDKQRNQQMWIIMRNNSQIQISLMILKITNRVITEKTHTQAQWNLYNTNLFTITLFNNQIIVEVNQSNVSMILLNSTTFNILVVGDQDGNFGTSIKFLYSLSIYNSSKRDNGVCHKMQIGGKQSKGVRKKSLPSFVEIVKMVGDLDIFLMIISHAIKKLKRNDEIVQMIRQTLNILTKFVEVKNLKHVKFSSSQRQRRLNAILCLCWQCSHQTYNALAVLELLRFLNIRGVSNPEDQLEILCNFVFWKHFEWQYQKIIIMKIKQLFSEIRVKENNHKYIKKYCQRILEETALYYREEQYNTCDERERDNILKIHYEFINLVKQQLFYLLSDRKSIEDYYDFIDFIIKLLFWTLSKKNNIIDAHDLTFSVQLSIFGRDLCQNLKDWISEDDKLLKIIKQIIDIVGFYEFEQKFYEERKIRIYKQSRGFFYYEDKIIKENLYFMAFYLVSLKKNVINTIVETDQIGINQINCIIWQRKVIEPLILAFDKSNIYKLTSQNTTQIRYYFERLSLKSLSYDQNKNLLNAYLNNQKFFDEVDYRLTQQFCKIISIKDLLDLMFYSLKRQEKSDLEITFSSNIIAQTGNNKYEILKCDKILSVLGGCQQLRSQQGLRILKVLNKLYNPKEQRLNIVTQHFTLKGLVKVTSQILKNAQSSIQLGNPISIIQVDCKSQVKDQLISKQASFIYCLQFYLERITVKDLIDFNGIVNQEEAKCHLENYHLNIEGAINSLATTQFSYINKLKKYYYFLQKQLLPISKCKFISYVDYLEQLNVKPIIQNKYMGVRLRKGSRQHLQFPKNDLKQQSKNMYLQFLDERNFNLLKVQRVWLEVQQRNKSFWSTFIGKQYYYSLYDGTGPMNQRYLLKRDSKKPKLQLPKMILKGSLQRSASIMSQKFEFNNDQSTSSIFDDAHLYRKQPVSCVNYKNNQQAKKQGPKNILFRVLLITASKIYQGTITVIDRKLIFKENQQINSNLYDKIYAAQCQKRFEDQCIKENYSFEQQLTEKCTAIVKRYLFHDIGLEIHTKNRSHFLIFNKKDQRQAFLYQIERIIRVLARDKIGLQAKQFADKWQNGFISNYHYLMKLNDLAGRSLNDLSQYYIFPWTVINFQDQIDANFFCKRQNFRDLSLPIGKLFKSKWQDIKKKYEMKKQMRNSQPQIPNCLYGSFYSNRAIVCNYLIRINPFSTQHYQLQSQQFDAADRLFYSIKDIYKSLTSCSGDFKQLIPQFYFFPNFLKNRCAYNLGQRQNKDIVHNVALPQWADDEYMFIFRMRKFLQCQIVSLNLNHWIDLIFGVYANKKYALKADNLFMGNLYLEEYDKYLCQKDKIAIQIFKQFGQVPVPIISSNHSSIKFNSNFMDSILHPLMKVDQYIPAKINNAGKVLQLYFYKRFTFILFQKQIRMYEQEKFDRDFVSINGEFQGGALQVWEMVDTQDKKHYCIIVHKKKTLQLLGYEIKKNIFKKYSIQYGDVFPVKHKCGLVCIFENCIFCSDGKNIYIYKNIKQEADQQYSTHNFSLICNIGKNKYLLAIFGQFTHHKSRIVLMKSNSRGIIVSIDQQNKCFVTQMSSNKISIFNYFEIKSTYFEERILQLQIHNMGFLIMITDYDRLLVYSFMGDMIVAKHLNFQKNANLSTQKPLNIAIWNQQLSEVIIGTNIGNLWKIDLFQLRKVKIIKAEGIWMEKLYLNKAGFRKQGLLKIAVNRLGRHSFTCVYAQNNKLYAIKSQKWQQTKKAQVLKKKIPNFW